MPNHGGKGATRTCSFGLAPSQRAVLPVNRMMARSGAEATSAAFGVLTPQPCIPFTAAPWVPGAATVLLGNQPSLDNVSTLNYVWGGIIQVAASGQFKELIP